MTYLVDLPVIPSNGGDGRIDADLLGRDDGVLRVYRAIHSSAGARGFVDRPVGTLVVDAGRLTSAEEHRSGRAAQVVCGEIGRHIWYI